MDKNKLRQLIIDQQVIFENTAGLIERNVDLRSFMKGKEIVIITGIRRCGKSSLLKLLSKEISGFKVYLSFEDVRFTDFTKENFQDVESIVMELFGTEEVTYFLDEVQDVVLWERWVTTLHSQNKKVFLTGSNSNLLSSEIATHLTGRNKVITLFPFSFPEFLRLRDFSMKKNLDNLSSSEQSIIFRNFVEYLTCGGFPLIIKTNDLELSKQYFEDIFMKDILNRYHIRQIKETKDLLLYIFSNTCKTYSYSTLKQVSQIKSLSTIKNYLDYCKNAYLLHTIDRFDYSIAKQKISSAKPYAGDVSFLKTIAFNFSENLGQRLETLVFLQLLQRKKQVFYHHGKKECDFVIKENLSITEAIQVCADLHHPLTKKRECEGLVEAMRAYKLAEGMILTLEDEETIVLDGKKILVKPVWKWLLEV